MSQHPVKRLALVAGVTAATLGLAAAPAAAATRVIDFSVPGEGPFDQSFFADQGVVFTAGSFVGFIQGDEALIGGCGVHDMPIAATTLGRPAREVSVDLAAAFQGTATYALAAYDPAGHLVGSTSQVITEEGSNGYATLSLTPSRPARTLVISCADPSLDQMDFGVAQVVVTTVGR